MKKLCLLLCLLTLFLYGCEKEPELPINSLLSETVLSELSLRDDEDNAIKLYGNLPPFLSIIAEFGSIDSYENMLRMTNNTMEDSSEIVVMDSRSDLQYSRNEHTEYIWIYEEDSYFLDMPLFDKYMLDQVMQSSNFQNNENIEYQITRMIFMRCESESLEYSEYVIYYETTLGNLVCFYVTETPDERHENTLYFFVPYDVVEKSAQTWQENISNNNSYTSYYDLFRKYRFQLKIAIS